MVGKRQEGGILVVSSFVGPFSFPFTNCIRLKADKRGARSLGMISPYLHLQKGQAKWLKCFPSPPAGLLAGAAYIFHALNNFFKTGNWQLAAM